MDAGFSGYAVGGAKVSEKHCGFLINAGGATASDVMELIRQIQAKVKEQFGVQLEPEIQFLGGNSDFRYPPKEKKHAFCNCDRHVRCGKKYSVENAGGRGIFLRR